MSLQVPVFNGPSARALVLLLLSFVALLALFWRVGSQPVPHHLAWHNVLEILGIAISALVFAVAWTAHRVRPQKPFVILSCGFLGMLLFDLGHVLSYPGMPDYFTSNSLGKAVNFWLVARYTGAVAMLAIVLFGAGLGRPPQIVSRRYRYGMLAGTLVLVLAGHAWFLFFPDSMPRTFDGATGLTPFKRWAESGVIILYLIALAVLLRGSQRINHFRRSSFAMALVAASLSEVFFVLYVSADDVYNVIGHGYKVVAWIFLYRAIFVHTVTQPYAELHASEAHLKAVLEAIPDVMFEVDHEGRFLYVHSERPDLLFAPAARLIGARIAEVLPADAASVSMAALAEASRTGSSHGRQMRLELANGDHTFELSVARKAPGASDKERFVVLSRDITERLRREDALRMLRLAVEQSPSTIMVTDLQSRLQYANQAFVHSTGYSVEEALGHTPAILHSGCNPPRTYEQMWRVLASGKPWRGELINRRKDGAQYLESVLISPVKDDAGHVTSYLAIKDDITQRRLDQEKIEQLSNFDALTGLPNRTLFATRFEPALAMSRRNGRQLAVLCVSMDNLKSVNESFGEGAGDDVLVDMAGRLKAAAGEAGLVSRHNGDEFIVVRPNTDMKTVAAAAESIQNEIRRPCRIGPHELVVTACVGISLSPDDGAALDTLVQRAVTAAFRAKADGRNSFRFFSAEMQHHSTRLLQLENALRTAISNKELRVVYQPQVNISTRRVVGVEALVRWEHPELGTISPAEFIPVAESSGQIIDIGEWILRSALHQAQAWRAQGQTELILAVNLSLQQFRHEGLLKSLEEVLAETGFPPARLELELTESIAMDNPEQAVRIVQALRDLGVLLSIDDFGTGYSSLSYLKRLQLNKLKIDKSFIDDIARDGTDVSIVTAVIGMARSLGMTTIAEGVETAGQLDVLHELGCDEVQGYFFSRPLTAQALEAYLQGGATRNAVPQGEFW